MFCIVLISLIIINCLTVCAQLDYLLYPIENRVCQVSEFNLDDFTGFRIQSQSITGYSYYHTRISFCDLGTPDLDDAYFPTIVATAIPWATKICALDIHTQQARQNRPRCFIMARRKELIPELWEKGRTRMEGGSEGKRRKEPDYNYVDSDIDSRPGALPAVRGVFKANYRPGTWVGGLFECPGLTDDDGISCTDENALPILPLMADNPLGWWSEFPDTRHYIQRVPLFYTYDRSGPYGKEGFYRERNFGIRMGTPAQSPFAPLPPNDWYDVVKATENYTGIGYIEDLAQKGESENLISKKKISEHLPSIFRKGRNDTALRKSRERIHFRDKKVPNETTRDTSSSSFSTPISRPLHKINPKLGRGRHLIPKRRINSTTITTSSASTTNILPTTTINTSSTPTVTSAPIHSLPPLLSSISEDHPLFDKGDGHPRRPIYPLVNGKIVN